MLICGTVLATVDVVTGSSDTGVVSVLWFAVLAVVLSPMPFPRSIGAIQAQEASAQDGRPIIYWRPGCPYCLRLRSRLGRQARRAHWVDIWSDPAGAAAVRAITGGDETVPTMVSGAESLVNPDASRVRELLRAAA
jgi:mycoredoxin